MSNTTAFLHEYTVVLTDGMGEAFPMRVHATCPGKAALTACELFLRSPVAYGSTPDEIDPLMVFEGHLHPVLAGR